MPTIIILLILNMGDYGYRVRKGASDAKQPEYGELRHYSHLRLPNGNPECRVQFLRAIGLFNSIINFILLVVETSLW